MAYIWLLLAVICLIYYIVCASYAGIGSSFIFIWLMGAIFFGLIFIVRILEIKNIINVSLWIRRIFYIVFAIGLSLFIFLEILIITGINTKPVNDCRYIIVLGCQIRGDRITKSLRRRLDAACEYAKDNPNTIIIVSGGQGKGENTTEAEAMYNYLVNKSVSPDRIIKEDKSTDTSENIRYSLEYIEDKDALIGIVTNDFHITRGMMIAKKAGLTNLCGIPSASDNILFINYMVRESIGIVKDFVYGNL